MTLAGLHSKFIDLPGLRLHVLTAPSRGTGLPVLLLHGFPQTSRSFRHQLRALAEAGHPVYAIDTRGCGRSDKPRMRITRALLADDIYRFCQQLGFSEVAIVGHDWGGIIAFKLAIDRPDLVTGLALIDAPCTVVMPSIAHVYWFKVSPLAEAFLADHAASLIAVRLGGESGAVLGGRPLNPYKVSTEGRGRPPWLTQEDLDEYVTCFDADARHAAIQYYRFAMPLHRVLQDAAAPGGERYQVLTETDIAAMWLHPDGYEDHPFYREFHDFAPEDRAKTFPNPSLLVYSNQFAARFPKHADREVPSGSPFADQYGRYLPDLTVRRADCGHYVPEEAPDLVNDALLELLG